MAFKIKHLHLKTPDPDKTAKWWVENLGAKIVAEGLHDGTGFKLDLDGTTLNVSLFIEKQTRPQHFGLEHICIGTDDFNSTVNKLKSSGALVLEESKNVATGKGSVFFETPEGVQLQVEPVEK